MRASEVRTPGPETRTPPSEVRSLPSVSRREEPQAKPEHRESVRGFARPDSRTWNRIARPRDTIAASVGAFGALRAAIATLTRGFASPTIRANASFIPNETN